jgi:hypothetical protein
MTDIIRYFAGLSRLLFGVGFRHAIIHARKQVDKDK